MTDTALSVITVAGVLVAIVGAIYGGWRRLHPGVERVSAALDAVIGKAAVVDRSGQLMEPSQPGLVHRVATVEEAVVEFRHLVGIVTETQHMLTEVRQEMGQINARVQHLEDIRVDKLIGQVESAHMWRAVADNAATDGD